MATIFSGTPMQLQSSRRGSFGTHKGNSFCDKGNRLKPPPSVNGLHASDTGGWYLLLSKAGGISAAPATEHPEHPDCT